MLPCSLLFDKGTKGCKIRLNIVKIKSEGIMKVEMRKVCAVLSVFVLIALGIACGGGGGGGDSEPAEPVLPEGTLYMYEEDLPGGYLKVSALDTFPEGGIWPFGVLLWMDCYGEDGFILVIEPDNPEELPARLSVATHPRGMNWTQETLDFMNDPDHPENKFFINEVIKNLEGGSITEVFNEVSTGFISGDFYITAGGVYKRRMKEGAQEMVDTYYAMIPFPDVIKNAVLPKNQFQAYISQQIYESIYEGGERLGGPGNGGFAELSSMLIKPGNWKGLDFKVTMDVKSLRLNVDNIVVASGKNYGRGPFMVGVSIYGDNVNYLITDFPEGLKYAEIVRTRMENRNWSIEDGDFLSFDIKQDATVYVAVDPSNTVLRDYLVENGWTFIDNAVIGVQMKVEPYTQFGFNLYSKDYDVDENPILLPGNGDDDGMMYFVIVDVGEPFIYPVGIDIIVTAHTTLMKDNPVDVVSYIPSLKKEGGIVCTGIENDGAEINGKPVDLTHVDFVENFDANVFVNPEGEVDTLQIAVGNVTGIQFVNQVLKNNGFRLIDTYNDRYPAFGGESQVLQVNNVLGYSMEGASNRVPLDREVLSSFANMNLLNSPNLIGVYLKSIVTDTDIEIWKDQNTHKVFNYAGIRNYIRDNAVSYRYFLSKTGEEVSLENLLKRIGNRNEGELTFSILVEFVDGKTFEISAGAFIQDYFTNIYDPIIGNVQ